MTSRIYLAGGCFWGLEKALGGLRGVVSTECGYANGDPHFIPDYMLVCSGRYGYRETVRVDYDPDVLPLEDILYGFLYLIDPTQERRQGCTGWIPGTRRSSGGCSPQRRPGIQSSMWRRAR